MVGHFFEGWESAMELREYLSIRRAYNLVRKSMDSPERLTFAEFAILCRLDLSQSCLRTSEIADYQGSLRPTTTHRTKHLASLGLIERQKGSADRRNVVCAITDGGHDYAARLCTMTCDRISSTQPLGRTSPERVQRYVDAMGAISYMAGDLTLLGLYSFKGEPTSISEIVTTLGLLQPTVSMSVAALEEEGLVERTEAISPAGTHVTNVTLTDGGQDAARRLVSQIAKTIVRRRPRS